MKNHEEKIYKADALPHVVTILLVCGPSGIGKTWVCKHLSNRIHHVDYDAGPHSTFFDRVYEAAKNNSLILVDLPIKTSTFINRNKHLYEILPVFIQEDEATHRQRLEGRGGTWKDSIISRRKALDGRAKKYAKFTGNSESCLKWITGFIEDFQKQ